MLESTVDKPEHNILTGTKEKNKKIQIERKVQLSILSVINIFITTPVKSLISDMKKCVYTGMCKLNKYQKK